MFEKSYSDIAKEFLKVAGIGGCRPGVSSLTGIMPSFGRLPYENFTKIIRAHEFTGEGRLRAPDIVLADHVEFGAGGTCFSLTFFFEQVLKLSGFETYRVLCDRSYGPATHCALVARMDGLKYLVDPGYLMDAPLFLSPAGESVRTGVSSTVRLVRLGQSTQYLLFTERGRNAKLRYRFCDAPVDDSTFKQRWVDSFDWAMMRHPCVSRNTPNGRLYMRDSRLRLIEHGGISQEILRKKFTSSIEDDFGIKAGIVEAAVDYSNTDRRLQTADYGI